MFIKEPHIALFIVPTGVGKTHLTLSLLETEYINHFDFIVIICPTLRYNSTDKTLFLIDEIIADKTLDKCHQPLLELAISGRHRGHSLWLLTQSYTAIPNNIRRQAKMLYVWYPKNRTDLNTIHEENDAIGPEELSRVKEKLKRGKHTCLIMRMEHPRAYTIHGVL